MLILLHELSYKNSTFLIIGIIMSVVYINRKCVSEKQPDLNTGLTCTGAAAIPIGIGIRQADCATP